MSTYDPDAADVEALAEVLLAVDVTPAERAGMPLPAGAYLIEANAGAFARAVLASDWLAAHDAQVRREHGERIAQGIEAERDARHVGLGGVTFGSTERHWVSDEPLNAAARIARHTPEDGA